MSLATWRLARTPARDDIRLVAARLLRERGAAVRVQVELACDDRVVRSEARGVGSDLVELRLVADATLAALREATGSPALALVGIKRLQAFDSNVVLVCLRGARPVLGAVPVDGNPAEGVARAVLQAAAGARGEGAGAHGEGSGVHGEGSSPRASAAVGTIGAEA